MANLILQDILRTSITTSLIIFLLLILKITIFKKLSKRFNYYIWLIVIIKLLFPFTYFTYTTSSQHIKYKQFTIDKSANLDILVIIYFVVVAILLIYRVLRYLKFKTLVSDLSHNIENEQINILYKNLLSELNISKNIEFKYTYEVENPAFFGLFKKYILIPPYDYKLEELDWILRHELTHYKSKDLYIKYTFMFLKCVYWFNPLLYLLDRIIITDCELHCDETVLENCTLEAKKDYAMTIVNSIERNLMTSNNFTTGLHRKSRFEKRLYNMFNDKGRSGVLIALILCLLSSFSFLKFDSISVINSNLLSDIKYKPGKVITYGESNDYKK